MWKLRRAVWELARGWLRKPCALRGAWDTRRLLYGRRAFCLRRGTFISRRDFAAWRRSRTTVLARIWWRRLGSSSCDFTYGARLRVRVESLSLPLASNQPLLSRSARIASITL